MSRNGSDGVGSWMLQRFVSVAVLLGDLVWAVAVVVALSPLALLPRRAASAVGQAYGLLAFWCWPLGRRTGMINLRRAYGAAMTEPRAWRATREVFGNLGRSIAEGIQFARRFKHGQPGWRGTYVAEDPALEQRLLADPRPKVFVTGHLGSWEVTTMLVGFRAGEKGAVVIRRIDNPFLDAIVRRGRFRGDSQWIDKRGAGGEALRRLRGGESIAILGDETAGYRGVFVDFFGRPASTAKAPALLSLMTGSPVVLGAAVRRSQDDKLVVRLAVFEPARYDGVGPAAVAKLTREIVRTYEQWVRDDPLQWRWIHWRWKHRPGGDEETYSRRDLKACFAANTDDATAPSGIQRDIDANRSAEFLR
jgi:KDO2-lipid IV(A) lauroyltransferase